MGLMALVLTAAGLAGCAKSGGMDADPTPFVDAIGVYLQEGNMGMAVHEVKELTVNGDAATAAVSLHAADVPQVKVRWTFEFAKADGAWKVTSHQQ